MSIWSLMAQITLETDRGKVPELSSWKWRRPDDKSGKREKK